MSNNCQLNETVKQILKINTQKSMFSLSQVSRKQVNLTLSQQMETNLLMEKSKFVVADPYNEFNSLVRAMQAEMVVIGSIEDQ